MRVLSENIQGAYFDLELFGAKPVKKSTLYNENPLSLIKWWGPPRLVLEKTFGFGLYAPWRSAYCYNVSFETTPYGHSLTFPQ